jgi:peptidoglycan/LPS O-acetylase OafA/YrhL
MKEQINDRNVGIDLLRGLSILYIIGFWHMLNYTEAIPHYNNIITYRITWVGLATFVFISGYYIGGKQTGFTKNNLVSFYKKRLLRIFPLYILAIAIFTLFGLSDIETSLKAAFAMSMFLTPAPPTLWFITMLLVFYTLAPGLIIFCKKYKITHIMISYLVLASVLLVYHHLFGKLDVRFLTYLPSFTFGILVAINGTNYFNNKICFSLLLLGTIFSFYTNSENIKINWMFATLMVTIGPFYLLFFFEDIKFNSLTTIKTISFLSYSSYCMYLFHRPIYIVLKKFYFPYSENRQIFYLVAFCLPCIVMISYASQKIYDILILSLTNRLTRTR